jgi:hypothetical protein
MLNPLSISVLKPGELVTFPPTGGSDIQIAIPIKISDGNIISPR